MRKMDRRRNKIVETVNQFGSISLKKLKEIFDDISEMTLRRDLEYLDRNRKLIRVHGGAKSVEVLIGTDDLFLKRSSRNLEEKKNIAEKAVKLLAPNTSIFIDSGTTTTEMARIFPDDDYLIYTNSLSCMLELTKLRKAQVNMLGGRLNPFSLSLNGVQSLAELSNINFQATFLGVTGYIAGRGFTCGSIEEAELKKMAIKKSEKTILLMDKQKIGITSTFTFANLEDVDIIISDLDSNDKAIKEFARKNILVI